MVLTYPCTYNFTGWPAAVVRGGARDEEMPIGVQVVAGPVARPLFGGREAYRDRAMPFIVDARFGLCEGDLDFP